MIPVVTSLALLAATPAFAFGNRTAGWWLLASDGTVVEHLPSIHGLAVEELAVSPDGASCAFLGASKESPTQARPYVWTRKSSTLLPLVETDGFFGPPAYSADGAWILFAHSPAGGAPGRHAPGKNAQLWRVRPDGRDFEQLTDSRGCKLGGASTRTGAVFFLHSSCSSTAAVEALQPGPFKGSAATLNLVELAVSRDGRRAAVVEKRYAQLAVHEVDLSNGATRELAAIEPAGTALRPQWDADSRSVLVQRGGTVWRLSRQGKWSAVTELKAGAK